MNNLLQGLIRRRSPGAEVNASPSATCRNIFVVCLVFALLPAAGFAATPASPSQEIKSLEQQYLASTNHEQREALMCTLKALAKSSAADNTGEALNAAVSAMLPAANSPAEAEALLEIGAALPAFSQETNNPGDAEFLVDARAAAAAAKHTKGAIEQLADIRIDRLGTDSTGRDRLASSHVQQIWRINSAQGVASFSHRSIMYASMSETLCTVRARVLKQDGRSMNAVVSADQPIVARSVPMYFDSRKRGLDFSGLEPGDVVEVEYYLLPASEVNPWAGYYARLDTFQDRFPTGLRRRVVIAPKATKLYTVEQGLPPAVVSLKGDETTRVWEMRDCGAQLREASFQGDKGIGPFVHVSTIGSIEELGHWYNQLLEPALKLDEHLRAQAEEILARNLSTQDKVRAVYESVQHGTRYVAFEFGVFSYQPYAVSTVEKRGFGDCKDTAAMIVALLRAVGVPAEFAMVRTRSEGAVAPNAYSVELFNHAVAYVPELNLFLDGTAKHAAVGELPLKDQGATALTVDAQGRAMLRTIPMLTPELRRAAAEGPATSQIAEAN
jgi:hypothetical protein